MTLINIGLMAVGVLGSWLFRRHRLTILLLASIVFLYALQPAGLEVALPTATLLIVVGVWWLTNANITPDDRRTLVLMGITATLAVILASRLYYDILIGIVLRAPITLGSAFAALPPLAVVALGVGSFGAFIPRNDEEARRRLALAFVIGIIIVLAILKLPALQTALTGSIAQNTGQTLPLNWQWLGFSYISFRLMHVLLDYRSKRLALVSLRDFALYVIFFPALTAGPIDRVEHFVRELEKTPPVDNEWILDGVRRISIGLFKKFVLADSVAYIALSPTLVNQASGSAEHFWVMVYAYAFQLFFDFAGYTDIVLGIARLARITLPENFTAPYSNRNITAFWNSWHITLATWFRNYFFTPLSRTLMGTRLRTRRLFIILIAQVSTMVLIGLWHGIALNFVLWGTWHGVGLWFHKWLTDHTRRWDEYVATRPVLSRLIHGLSVLATFHFVALGWIFFALPDLKQIGKVFAGLVGIHG